MPTKDILLNNRVSIIWADMQQQISTVTEMVQTVEIPNDITTARVTLRSLKSFITHLQTASEITRELIDEYQKGQDRSQVG